MTITYQAYSPEEGPYAGVIPKEYVATLGGETYKYASPMAGGGSRHRRRKTASLRKKRGNTRRKSRKSRRSFS